MLSSVLDMARQRRPSGALDTVDDDWKDSVRDALKRKEISRADLARQIGVSAASITLLLKPGTSQTRLAGRIAKALDMRSTAGRTVAAAEMDSSLERILRAWRKLDAAKREALAVLAES